MSARKRIILHGYLKDLEPRELAFEADTVVEALTALSRQIPAFKPRIGKDRHLIRVLGFDDPASWDIPTDVEELHIFPDFSGRKSGVVRIVLGFAMIAVSFIPGIGQIAAGLFFSAGMSMATGGLLEVLYPAPKADTGGPNDPEASKYLGAPQNTVKIGTRIPILYGRRKVYGHILSFDIQAKDVVA